jgi:hypothetical protein
MLPIAIRQRPAASYGSKVPLKMPTKSQIRFAQVIGAVLDSQVELLRELVDRTLERVTRKPQQAPGEMHLRRSA